VHAAAHELALELGVWRRNSSYSASEQKPITRSTPERLYQLTVEQHDLAARRQVLDVALEVPLAALGSLGFSSATTRAPRGLRCSMKRLIVPPLPAASRPSKMITTRWPVSFTQACSFSSSTCRRYFCFS
jgi:hypothetical protein